MKKSAKCEVVFDGYGWRNILEVTSPTGNRISLCCNGRWDEMSEELLKLVKGLEYELGWNVIHEMELSYDIMAEIKSLKINNK